MLEELNNESGELKIVSNNTVDKDDNILNNLNINNLKRTVNNLKSESSLIIYKDSNKINFVPNIFGGIYISPNTTSSNIEITSQSFKVQNIQSDNSILTIISINHLEKNGFINSVFQVFTDLWNY